MFVVVFSCGGGGGGNRCYGAPGRKDDIDCWPLAAADDDPSPLMANGVVWWGRAVWCCGYRVLGFIS